MAKKLTYEEVKDFFEKSGCILLSTTYIRSLDKLDYICVCGNKSSIRFNDFKRGKRCKECMKQKLSKRFSLDYEYVKNYFKEHGCELLESDYKNSTQKLRFVCFCGRTSTIRFADFQRRKRCGKCGKEASVDAQRFSLEQVREEFAKEGCVLLESEYKNARTKIRYICKCGSISRITYDRFRRGHRCKECANELLRNQRKFDKQHVSNLLAEKGMVLIGEYINMKTPTEIRCHCGHISTRTPGDALYNNGCLKCSVRKGEKHHNWNPNISEDQRIRDRNFEEYREWRAAVYKRDNYQCRKCGRKRNDLNAHHIENYASNPDKRTDVDNGITLCRTCHTDFHKKYGYTNNNLSQLIEWMGGVL